MNLSQAQVDAVIQSIINPKLVLADQTSGSVTTGFGLVTRIRKCTDEPSRKSQSLYVSYIYGTIVGSGDGTCLAFSYFEYTNRLSVPFVPCAPLPL